MSGGAVEGRVGTPGGAVAFTVSVDSSGTVKLDQARAIKHPNGADPDDAVTLSAANLIRLTRTDTITDRDGDSRTDSASIDIGQALSFKDDGPTVRPGATLTASVDEDGLSGANADDGRPGEVSSPPLAASVTGAAGALTALFDFGADGQGTTPISLANITTPVATGLTSGGSPVVVATSGGVLYGYVETTGGTGYNAGDRVVFTLTVGSNGSYEFTLKDQIDHPTLNGGAGDDTENTLSSRLDLSKYVIATDRDGDATSLSAGTFLIDVRDDIPVQTNATVSAQVDEDELTGQSTGNPDGDGVGTTANGSLTSLFKVGADETGSFSLVSNPSGLPQITSKGEAVHYVVNGSTLTGYVDGGTAGYDLADRVVFTLQVQSNGDFAFTLKDQIDHLPNVPANDDNQTTVLDFTNAIQFTDADGDTVALKGSGTFTIAVEDDIPEVISGASAAFVVDEDSMNGAAGGDNSTGIADGDGVDDEDTLSFDAIKALVRVGADEGLTAALDLTVSGQVKTTAGAVVTSQGKAVLFGVDGTDVVGFVDGNNDGKYAAGDRLVFRLHPETNGSVTFDLIDQVDHPWGSGDGALLPISLSGAFTVKDFDGDAVTLPATAVVANVQNDAPADTAAFIQVGVGEDELSQAAGDLSTGNGHSVFGSSQATLSNAMLLTLVTPGADEGVQFSLNTALGGQAFTLGNFAVSSKGETVFVGYDGADLVGFATMAPIWRLSDNGEENASYQPGDRVVFRLHANDDGSFTFKLTDQLDHKAYYSTGTDDAQTLTLDLSKFIVATDFDGDVANLGVGSIRVVVEDDVPVGATINIALDDDNQPGGNPGFGNDATDGAASDDIAASTTVSGQIIVGADEPAAISFLGTGAPQGFSYESSGSQLLVKQGGTTVLTITLTDANTGAFTVTQNAAIQHPAQGGVDNGEQGANLENNLLFTIGYQVTDKDGDSRQGTLAINVDDDTPVIGAGPADLIENGSFEALGGARCRTASGSC